MRVSTSKSEAMVLCQDASSKLGERKEGSSQCGAAAPACQKEPVQVFRHLNGMLPQRLPLGVSRTNPRVQPAGKLIFLFCPGNA